jgi:hypothetical protein
MKPTAPLRYYFSVFATHVTVAYLFLVRPMSARAQYGIRGGVLVLAIALALFVARTTFYLFTFGSAVYASPDILWTFGGIFEFVANVLLVAAAVLLLVLLFRKRRSFPRRAIAFLVGVVAFSVVDLTLALCYRDSAAEFRVPWRTSILLAALCGAAVLYLCRSERVRATFTR